jgi:hypothetical protein
MEPELVMARSTRRSRSEQEESPVFWFEQFVSATQIGEGVIAWNAQKELHRLGYVVTLRIRRETKGGAR